MQMIPSCETIKQTNMSGTGDALINPSIIVETSYEVNVNDIIAACNEIKPCKNIVVEDWSVNKLHMKIFFNRIKDEERGEMVDRLNALSGVHVIEISH
jgi:hypothetical protein